MRWFKRAGLNLEKFQSPTWLVALGFLGLTGPVMGQCDKRIVAYYAYWDQPAYTSANIPMTEVTHIEHAFISLDTTKNDGTLSVAPAFLEPTLIARAHAAGVKVLVSVGGSDSAQATAFELVSASAAARVNFANNLYNFCKTNGYDGVDIDYEFPLNTTDESNLTLMMQAIRSVLPAPTWLISMATSAMGNNTWNGAYYMNLNALEGIVDFFNVMDYDFYGGWDTNSGHLAPQYQNPADPQQAGSFKTSLDWYLVTAGITPSKINAGMPFYADEFTSVNVLWKNCGGNCPVVNQNYGTFVKPRLIAMGYTVQWDSSAQANYLTGSDFITYDSVTTVANKTTYALGTRGVGGVMIWEISQDYDGASQDLLTATYNVYVAQCPINTPTSTFTATATMTATTTNTATKSATNTLSPTGTPTKTVTSTATNTATATKTNTPTATNTPVPPTKTFTSTLTNTPVPPTNTPTFTSTSTSTGTSTFTRTNTSTNTATSTNAPINTFTATSTATHTGTPTFTPTNTSTNTNTGTSTNSPTSTGTSTHTSTSIITPTRTNTATNTFTPTSTPTLTFTHTFTQTNTSTNTPVNSFTSTSTPTNTHTRTFTDTSTNTPTHTMTPTSTNTPTNSPTGTFTPISTSTPTNTPSVTETYTSTLSSVIVISPPFPNPSNGSPITFKIQVPGESTVTLDVFTLAFRKIYSETTRADGLLTLQWDLKDVSGIQVANEVYYVRIHAAGSQSVTKILKVLIIR